MFLQAENPANGQISDPDANSLEYQYRKKFEENNRKAMEFLQTNPDSALYYQKRSLDYAYLLKDYSGVSAGMMLFVNVYRNKGEYAKAIEYLLLLADLAEKLEKRLDKAYVLVEIGNTYYGLNFASQAQYYYLQALINFKQIQNPYGAGLCFNNLGQTFMMKFRETGDTSMVNRAMQMYRLGYSVRKPLNDKVLQAQSFDYLGTCYLRLKKYDKALNYYQAAINLLDPAKKTNTFYVLDGLAPIVYTHIGNLFLEQEQYDQAERHYLNALEISRVQGATMIESLSCTYLAQLFRRKGEIPKAIKYAHEAAGIAKKSALLSSYMDATRELADLYRHTGNENLYHKYSNEYYRMKDSLEGGGFYKKIGSIYDLNILTEKQKELQRTEEIVSILDRANKSETKLRIFFEAGMALLAIVIAMIIFYSIRQVKLNRQLRIQNREIHNKNEQISSYAGQLSEANNLKSLLIQIMGHDLRNLFQNIFARTIVVRDQIKHNRRREALQQSESLVGATHKAVLLFENLLTWTQLKKQEILVNIKTVDLSLLVKENITLLIDTINERKIQVHNETPEVFVFGDPNMIRTIIRNLLFNAISNCPEGGDIHLGIRSVDNQCQWFVRNLSDGFQEEVLNWINKPDSKLEAIIKTSIKTKGLGLVISKSLILMNKGKLYATYDEPYAEVGIFIPLKQINEEAQKIISHKTNSETFRFSENELERLKLLLTKLRGYRIFQTSQILKALYQETIVNDPRLADWKERLESAIFSSDASKFEQLTSEKYFIDYGVHSDCR